MIQAYNAEDHRNPVDYLQLNHSGESRSFRAVLKGIESTEMKGSILEDPEQVELNWNDESHRYHEDYEEDEDDEYDEEDSVDDESRDPESIIVDLDNLNRPVTIRKSLDEFNRNFSSNNGSYSDDFIDNLDSVSNDESTARFRVISKFFICMTF